MTTTATHARASLTASRKGRSPETFERSPGFFAAAKEPRQRLSDHHECAPAARIRRVLFRVNLRGDVGFLGLPDRIRYSFVPSQIGPQQCQHCTILALAGEAECDESSERSECLVLASSSRLLSAVGVARAPLSSRNKAEHLQCSSSGDRSFSRSNACRQANPFTLYVTQTERSSAHPGRTPQNNSPGLDKPAGCARLLGWGFA